MEPGSTATAGAARVERAGAALAAEVLAVEDLRRRALVATDLDTLAELFDDDLVHVHAPGVVHGKQQLLEHTATRSPYLSVERTDLVVRVVGPVAVVTGGVSNRLRTAEGGERTLHGVATQVLVRGGVHGWRFVSFQMTPLGERAWPTLPSETDGAGGTAGMPGAPGGPGVSGGAPAATPRGEAS